MANAEIDALLGELEALNTSPGRGAGSDELEGVLEQDIDDANLNRDRDQGLQHSPVCPLKKRPLRQAVDSPNNGSVASPASVGSDGNHSIESGEFIQPRPPLVPKRRSDRAGSAGSMQSGQLTSRSSATGSKSDLFSSEVDDNENVISDMELELENLLNGGNSNNSSPLRMAKEAKDNKTTNGIAEVLDVDDFDDTPRSVDIEEIVNEVTNMSRTKPPESEPDADKLSREVESALESPVKQKELQPPQPQYDGDAPPNVIVETGGTKFTPLPVEGVVANPNKKKCIKVTLHGGPRAVRGVKESSFARNVCCSNLLCVKCNFSVLTFVDAAWDNSVDYMFFRNSSCKADRLSTKLVSSENYAAYACQCSWVTCEDGEMEPSALGLQWCCAGHVLGV